MDKVYKADIPKYQKVLEELKGDFSGVQPTTDWVRLRIEPLLAHANALAGTLRSRRFAKETARLRKGVAMFRADLVYLRTNIEVLKSILADERRKRTTRKSEAA